MEGISVTLLTVLAPVIVTVSIALVVGALVYLKSKTDNEQVKEALNVVIGYVKLGMRDVGDVIVKELKEKAADNKITADDGKDVRAAVIAYAKGKAVKEFAKLENKIENLDAILEKKIEEELEKRKDK
jgi:hypothetical protein